MTYHITEIQVIELTKERDALASRIRDLEAENAHLKSMMRGQTFVTDMTAPETGGEELADPPSDGTSPTLNAETVSHGASVFISTSDRETKQGEVK